MNNIIEIFKIIGHFFASVYNFIQTSPFFTSNLFNFIIVAAFFVWLLFYFLDVVSILDKKSKETLKSITDAENKKSEAQKELEETKKSLQHIDNDVKEIVNEAKNLAQNIEDNSKIKLDAELLSLKNRENLLKNEQINKAKDEISIVIANAAVAVSKEYIGNSLDEETHKELIYNFINDLDERMKI